VLVHITCEVLTYNSNT